MFLSFLTSLPYYTGHYYPTNADTQNEVPPFPYKHHQRPQKTVLGKPSRGERKCISAMASQVIYPDPPPSYAEATAADRVDIRRHTLAGIISSPAPLSSPSSSSSSSRPVYYYCYSRRRPASPVFPQAFSLYCQSARRFVIGEGRNSPLYAVSTDALLSSRPDVVIHSGISQDIAPLATVDHEPFSRSASIRLPGRPGSRFPAAHEMLEPVGPFTRVMGFSIETAASGRSREHFEWRHSSGVEVEALGGRHSGWKLVRVSLPSVLVTTTTTTTTTTPTARNNNDNNNTAASFPPPRKHGSGNGNGNVIGHSSDGKEVVAVWSGVSMSLSKVLRFRFLGSGADGSLGDRWAVMAVASALAIWNRDRRSRSSGGSATVSAGF